MTEPDFLGRGHRFPVRVNGRGGLSYVSGEESIAQAVWIVLATPVGSRIMRPTFGCGIHDQVFAPADAGTLATVRTEVQRALLRWEPRIDVLDVQIDSPADAPQLLLVHVHYRIRANNAFANLVYPFYIAEGQGGV
jgi:uncharacterized protein